ncbi:MAG: oligosaccharide flippase family protein [Elusimicrobiota bacterium]|jgi:O-antigen/teichoic acid export membrane protein
MNASPPAPSRAHRFAHGMLWTTLGQFSVFAVNFFTIPYLVNHMGLELYGLYVLLHTAMNYLMVTNLGAGAGITKFVAEFAAAREYGRLRQTLRYGAWFHGLGALLGAAVLLACLPWILRSFNIPAPLAATAAFVLTCAAAAAVFFAFCIYSSTALQGLHRFDLSSGFALLSNLLVPLAVAGAFLTGHGIKTAACGYVAAHVLSAAAGLLVLRKILPRGAGQEASAFPLQRFSRYCFGLSLGPIAGLLIYQFDKILISQSLPLNELTLYSVPSGLIQRVQSVAATIANVMTPMMSEISRPEHAATLRRVYIKSTRALLLTILPGLTLLFVFMPNLLNLWLGQEFGDRSTWPARFLVLAAVFYLLSMTPSIAAASREKTWYLSASAWLQAGLCILLWLWLIPRYRILGAAIGACLAQAATVSLYIVIIHRRVLRLSWAEFLDQSLAAPLISAAALLAVTLPTHHLASSWLRLAAMGTAALAVYYGSAWLLLPSADKALIQALLRWRGRTPADPPLP